MTPDARHGWLLRSRARGDTSLVLELFTLEDGRTDVLAKGGRKNPLLQPFTPLWLTLAGRGSLPLLGKAEASGRQLSLAGEALWCGFYLNELMLRLLPANEPATLLFSGYGESLQVLSAGSGIPQALRRFELLLLRECGYELVLERDVQGEALDPDACYRLGKEGLEITARGFSGAALAGFAGGDWNDEIARASRDLLREALGRLLGPVPLKSREMLRSLRAGKAAPLVGTGE